MSAARLLGLLRLDGMGPTRARRLVQHWGADLAWERVIAGDASVGEVAGAPHQVASWAAQARGIEPLRLLAAHEDAGIDVAVLGSTAYPERLAADPDPPLVLFSRGRGIEAGPTVAVVGTRRCSRYGHDVARDLGRELSKAGVTVVSGLAKGIDAAAHERALAAESAPPLGVVATGLERAYPASNRRLHDGVAAAGALWSEAPVGTIPERWRFPARNRIIAGVADVVCVVESGLRGGSMHTVHEALERGVEVMAVPGPIRSASSGGANRLIADGARPVLGVGDVLEAVGQSPGAPGCDAVDGSERAMRVDPAEARILDALGWEATSVGTALVGSGLAAGEFASAVARLVDSGLVTRGDGTLERRAPV